MGKEEKSLAFKEALACLARIETLLETMAENLQEHLEASRRLLDSRARKAEAAQVDASRVTPSTDQIRSQALTIREVTIHPVKRMVTFRDQSVELTTPEFDILFCLMRNAGRVLSCQQLVREAQGYELDEMHARYLIRPRIRRLRQKLVAEPGAQGYIHNVRGVGYSFERRIRKRD